MPIQARVIAIAGTRITRVVDQLADRTGLGEATSGAVLLGAATSLSGSVLSVTAAYRDGSIYHTMTADSERWVALTLLMSAILIMGLIRRQRYGVGRIGAESLAIMVLVGLGVVLMFIG